MKVSNCSEECGKSEVDLFSVPPTQTYIEEGVWDDIQPLSNFETGTITFTIPGNTYNYINLAETELWAEVSIQKKNTTSGLNENINFNVDNNISDIGPVNNFLQSLFSQVQVYINDQEVENSDSNYAYRAYLESLLCYGKESKDTFLRSQLFIKDQAANMGSIVNVVTNDNRATSNPALVARRDLFKQQPVQMKGRIHCNLFNMNRYMLSQANIRLKLTRNKPEFYLVGTLEGAFATIGNCFLRVRRVKISPALMLEHAMALEKTHAKYPVKRVIMRNYNVSYSAIRSRIDNMYKGVIPNRLVLGFVSTNSYDGSLTTNPYNFENFTIKELVLKISSRAFPYSSGLKFDFENNRYLQGYNTLYQGIKEIGNDITYTEYKTGYTLFVFDLTPDSCSGEHFNLVKDGDLELEIVFTNAPNQALTAVCYMEFDSVLEITKERNFHIEQF